MIDKTGVQVNTGWRKQVVSGPCELWTPCYMDGRDKKSKPGVFAEARVS